MTVLTNRLKNQRANRLVKSGRKLTPFETRKYGETKQLRYVAGTDEPIYPIGYIKFRKPMQQKSHINCYSVEGRVGLHDNLRINTRLLHELMRQPPDGASIQLADNELSLFSAQRGKCAITGIEFQSRQEIFCHYINPKQCSRRDRYSNLKLVYIEVHNLIVSKDLRAIEQYFKICNLTDEQLAKVNDLRRKSGLATI